MKKIAAVAILASIGFAPAVSQAAFEFAFSPDGTSTFYNAKKLWLSANPDPTTIRIDVGADGVVGNNDTFTETGSFDLYKLSGGSSGNVNTSSYSISAVFDLTGKLTNYVTDGGSIVNTTPSTAAAQGGQGSVTNPYGMLNDLYDINFTGGTIKFYDGANKIAEFGVLGGGATKFSFLAAGTATQALGVNAQLTEADSNYWKDTLGNALEDYIPFMFGIATGSVNFAGIGSNPQNDPTGIYLQVSDNGTTAQFNNIPEPETLALLGIGMLGFGFSKRRARS